MLLNALTYRTAQARKPCRECNGGFQTCCMWTPDPAASKQSLESGTLPKLYMKRKTETLVNLEKKKNHQWSLTEREGCRVHLWPH